MASFNVGKRVQVRWLNGMQYVGKVTKTDHKTGRCCVEFEGKGYWILFKDISDYSVGSDIICQVCQNGKSKAPNEIVLCDRCEDGYHQLCHTPEIDDSVLLPNVDWICYRCGEQPAPSKSLSEGLRSKKVGLDHLPYNLSSLTWDSSHLCNKEDTYCYCSRPGEWYVRMFQCADCKQWFHEACLNCISMQKMLFGDKFFYFLCSCCNAGAEYIVRLPFDWTSMIQLAMFHLTLSNHRKYFDFDEELIPFLIQNWQYFGFKEMGPDERRSEVWRAMCANTDRFASGKEIKKKKSIWCLRGDVTAPRPPNAPARPPKGTRSSIGLAAAGGGESGPVRGSPPPIEGYWIQKISGSKTEPARHKNYSSPVKRIQTGSFGGGRSSGRERPVLPIDFDGPLPLHDIRLLRQLVQRYRGGHTLPRFGSASLIARGMKHEVLGRRVRRSGQIDFLIDWS